MEPTTVSWLVASASSPLVAVLALWTVYVFHTYRRRWRTVDLFLLAMAAQELITAIFMFSFTVLSLINPPLEMPCSFIQWGLVSTRTFQVATLTSMVVDRALTVRWPYKYRFSVRRNQIRYHIAVLAMIAVLVGVAAVFARIPPTDDTKEEFCSSHPVCWDLKFVVFLLVLYGVLVLTSLVCTVQVESHRCRARPQDGPFNLPDCVSPELPPSATNPLDTTSSTGSTRALHRPCRQASRRPYGPQSRSDFRWPAVLAVSLVCCSLNHLPYLVLTALATALPWLWTPWHEVAIAWLRLAEGVLVPIVLCLTDQPLRSALKRTFQRRSGTLSPLVADDGPFQMYFDKDHYQKKATFGSVTPVGIITNYRRTPGKRRRTRKYSGRYMLPGLYGGDSVLEKPNCLAVNCLHTEPLSKLSCADLTSIGLWQDDENEDERGNIYATLSENFSTLSCKSMADSVLSEGDDADDVYGGSFTTIANDDFEFHDTRPCGGEVRMRPSINYSDSTASDYRQGKTVDDKDDYIDDLARNKNDEVTLNNLQNIFSTNPDRDGFDPGSDHQENDPDDKRFEDSSSDGSNSDPQKMSQNNVVVQRKPTSYSMNDLDLIDNGDAGSEEAVFVLPVKSESTMSLYRLPIRNDLGHFAQPSKPQTNLTGDSGFGSGSHCGHFGCTAFPGRRYLEYQLRNGKNPLVAGYGPSHQQNRHQPSFLHSRAKWQHWISTSYGACVPSNGEDSTNARWVENMDVARIGYHGSECEEFPFKTYLANRQACKFVSERSNSDMKINCKQKKIAVTDFL